jgi:tRNA nucleotidyltransferase (CCA-adding enzyme)
VFIGYLCRLLTVVLGRFRDLMEFAPRFSSEIQSQIPWKILRFLDRIQSKILQEIPGEILPEFQ